MRTPCPVREAARLAGERHYFTGIPCKRGHIAKRFTKCSKCMECGAAAVRAHREANPEWWVGKDKLYSERNPGARAAACKRYKERHPDRVKAKSRIQNKKNWAKNKEKLSEAHSQWRAENREYLREYAATWRRENPEKFKEQWIAYKQARRARNAAAEGSYTLDDVRVIEARQKQRCACCGEKRKLTVDHIVPLARGGSNWPRNLQMLCRPCNSTKNAKDPIAFAQERGLLL